MQAKELDMLIIHMGMELNLHKTLCHFLVAQLQVELNLDKTLCHFLVAQLQDLEPNVSRMLNGLIQENGVDSKKTKMGPNNDQGLVHVIKAIDEVN
jgi:hypothetical protein